MLTSDDLTEDQENAIDRLYDHDETMLIGPKGFGKCVVGFTAIKELIFNGILKRVLVLSTAQVCTQVWANEAAKWSHLTIDHVCLTGHDIKTRKKLMDLNTPIVICNFENIAWLFNTYPDHNFDGLLVDEITKLKSVGGAGYKKLRSQLKHFKWTTGMTADPVAQESIEIYGQMLIIDKGKRLGRNKEKFQHKYFMQMDYLGYDWELQPGGLERLTAVLSDIIYTIDGTEYEQNLPELVDYAIPVLFNDEVRAIYNRLIKNNVVNIMEYTVEAPNEAILQLKLQQICGGTIYNKEEFEPNRIAIHLHSEKMKAVDHLIFIIDTPVLIAYQFNFERDALIEKYNAPVFSASKGKKANEELLKAWEKGIIPVMLIHPKSGSYGLNLQYGPCHDLICLGYFWSAHEWGQLIARLRRRGQKSPIVNRHTIYCRDTVEDCVIKPRLNERKEASELFHEYLQSLRDK